MIDKVKKEVYSLKGKLIKFRYNGSRNQIEEFRGTIVSCHNYVFVVSVDKITRSFSYSDVLIGMLEVDV